MNSKAERRVTFDEVREAQKDLIKQFNNLNRKIQELESRLVSARARADLDFFKDDGKEYVASASPREVTLDLVLNEIDTLPTRANVEGSFIGLVNDDTETIQFVRFEEDEWLIDVPVLERDVYSYSLHDDELTTEKVKEIIKRFFSGENWKVLCNFHRLD